MNAIFNLPLPSNFYIRLLALNALFSVFWVAYHLLLRRVIGNHRKAADFNSFSYCVGVGLVWNVTMIYRGIFDTSKFLQNPFSCPLLGVTDLYVEIYFVAQIAYNITDMILDWDPNFVVHHILCIAGSLTPLLRRLDMASGMVVNLFVAELGGVPYHISRMVKDTIFEAFVRRIFLYLYGGTRLLLYLPMAIFAGVRFFQIGWTSDLGDTMWNLWCVLASFAMVFINIRWFVHHWSKPLSKDNKTRDSSERRTLVSNGNHHETIRRRQVVVKN